jgi:single-strand selective monofunctional uracil DNA glycosylase
VPQPTPRGSSLVSITRELSRAVATLDFEPPVTHVYNPLSYARRTMERYLRRYGNGTGVTLFLGMNPGPFGMAQTGVPFGEVAIVRDWLEIEGSVDRPVEEHPRRPVQGFACSRSEVSGRRLWGLFRERALTPDRFFRRFFVMNYCPLLFLEESGRNRTPDRLPRRERDPLFAACDRALRRSVERLGARRVLAIGGFAEERARHALAETKLDIGRIPHPSPANPAANRGWSELALRALREQGVEL